MINFTRLFRSKIPLPWAIVFWLALIWAGFASGYAHQSDIDFYKCIGYANEAINIARECLSHSCSQ
jgi:hypothetical protein